MTVPEESGTAPQPAAEVRRNGNLGEIVANETKKVKYPPVKHKKCLDFFGIRFYAQLLQFEL